MLQASTHPHPHPYFISLTPAQGNSRDSQCIRQHPCRVWYINQYTTYLITIKIYRPSLATVNCIIEAHIPSRPHPLSLPNPLFKPLPLALPWNEWGFKINPHFDHSDNLDRMRAARGKPREIEYFLKVNRIFKVNMAGVLCFCNKKKCIIRSSNEYCIPCTRRNNQLMVDQWSSCNGLMLIHHSCGEILDLERACRALFLNCPNFLSQVFRLASFFQNLLNHSIELHAQN